MVAPLFYGEQGYSSPRGRAEIAAAIIRTHQAWARLTPQAHASLRDPAFAIGVARIESNFRPNTRTGSYHGLFQVTLNNGYFNRIEGSIVRKLNAMSQQDPYFRPPGGGSWTGSLVRQHYMDPRVNTMIGVEHIQMNMSQMGYDRHPTFLRMSPEEQRAVAYQSHQLPAGVRVTLDNYGSNQTFNAHASRTNWYRPAFISSNPSIYGRQGERTPSEVVQGVARLMRSGTQEFAVQIAQATQSGQSPAQQFQVPGQIAQQFPPAAGQVAAFAPPQPQPPSAAAPRDPDQRAGTETYNLDTLTLA